MDKPMTAIVRARVSGSLHHQIKKAAHREGLSIAAYVRRILTLWHNPDQATLDLCLVDPPVEYEVKNDS
jgi:hypothetical protein